MYIAKGHRRALIGAGLGFAASMLVLGAVLLIARGAYLNSVPNSVLPGDAAAAAFDILVRFIKTALRTFLVAGLVVAAAAFLTGPSITAVRTRSAFSSGLGWIPGAANPAAWAPAPSAPGPTRTGRPCASRPSRWPRLSSSSLSPRPPPS